MPITKTHTKRIATALAKLIGSDKVNLTEVENTYWIIGKNHCIEIHLYSSTNEMSVINHLHTAPEWVKSKVCFTGNILNDLQQAREACGL